MIVEKFKKKKVKPIFEMAFLGLGETATLADPDNKEQLKKCLNKVWDATEKDPDGQILDPEEVKKIRTDQIIFAGKIQGYSPLHLLSFVGNAEALDWYFEKYNEWVSQGLPVPDINEEDRDGNSPLFLACWRGYTNKKIMQSRGENDLASENKMEEFDRKQTQSLG